MTRDEAKSKLRCCQITLGFEGPSVDGKWGVRSQTRLNTVADLADDQPSRAEEVKRLQICVGLTGDDVDGWWGPLSQRTLDGVAAIARGEDPTGEAPTPKAEYDPATLIKYPDSMITLTQDGIGLIVYSETGGKAYYDRFLAAPSWPVAKSNWYNDKKNNSGVTIGVGYDLGQETTFTQDWSGVIGADQVAALSKAVGLRKLPAQAMARRLKADGIRIPWESAIAVFTRRNLPREAAKLEKAYPGVQRLHPNVQAALLSMVYQWGPGIRLDAQRQIKSAVAAGNYQGIAVGLRAMKTHGYAPRRELEAKYVAVSATLPKPNLA